MSSITAPQSSIFAFNRADLARYPMPPVVAAYIKENNLSFDAWYSSGAYSPALQLVDFCRDAYWGWMLVFSDRSRYACTTPFWWSPVAAPSTHEPSIQLCVDPESANESAVLPVALIPALLNEYSQLATEITALLTRIAGNQTVLLVEDPENYTYGERELPSMWYVDRYENHIQAQIVGVESIFDKIAQKGVGIIVVNDESEIRHFPVAGYLSPTMLVELLEAIPRGAFTEQDFMVGDSDVFTITNSYERLEARATELLFELTDKHDWLLGDTQVFDIDQTTKKPSKCWLVSRGGTHLVNSIFEIYQNRDESKEGHPNPVMLHLLDDDGDEDIVEVESFLNLDEKVALLEAMANGTYQPQKAEVTSEDEDG